MRKSPIASALLYSLLFAVGYLSGIVLHPIVSQWLTSKKPSHTDVSKLFNDSITDITTGKKIPDDTLSAHAKNLLIFWSPTCEYCQMFFQNRINNLQIGVFCFPLTQDLEYLSYYVTRNQLEYPQLVMTDSTSSHPVHVEAVPAIPMFLAVDSTKAIIWEHIGIEGIENLLSTLYN